MKRILLILAFSGIAGLFAQRAADYKAPADRGRSLALAGEYQAAVAALDSAIRIMPYYPALFKDRGYARLQLRDYQGAVEDFSVVLDKQPYQHEIRMLRGVARLNLNLNREALQDFQAVKQEAPENPRVDAYIDLARQAIAASQGGAGNAYEAYLQSRQYLEDQRYNEMRRREAIIWGTVVPLLFWTTVFATW